ncbi:MAG: DUF3775 domain-containing protein [Methyloceanibacter sp.]|nr:DUF3775 domain-containing protein [Methyloceanibacter sp.]
MEPTENPDQLTISPETAFYIIVKAREFDEQVPPTDPDSGSNPSDDREVDVLEESPDDAVEQELDAALGALNIDEQLDLMALTWLGRGDFTTFAQARQEADDMRDKHIAIYLKGTPKLGDYLEEGLAQLGHSLEDFEKNRL